jgi:hypothetical protein
MMGVDVQYLVVRLPHGSNPVVECVSSVARLVWPNTKPSASEWAYWPMIEEESRALLDQVEADAEVWYSSDAAEAETPDALRAAATSGEALRLDNQFIAQMRRQYNESAAARPLPSASTDGGVVA